MIIPLKNFFLIFICVLGFDFLIFLIAFLILDFLMRGSEMDKYVNEKSIKDLVKKFHKKLDEVSNQRTDEILECLKEMEELDNVYYVMVDNNYKIMSEENYIKIKCDILSKIIQSKFDSIKRDKRERYKALLDEINVCQKRYPLYKNVFLKYISVIEEKI